jgi:hypothetical protein
MMAKMFYTLEETKSALGKNEEEIKQLTREGRLREFRDGPRLMFKADQVETLKGEIGVGDQVNLGPSDTGGPIGLVDSKGASGSMISLADSDVRATSGPGMQLKDDTAMTGDVGLSASGAGIPSPTKRAGRSGINVLGDSAAGADPMAQTSMGAAGSGQDQINLEGVGSGSGLLDLTRESDDTSLGAELLDEIAPGQRSKGGDSALGGTRAAAATTAGGASFGGASAIASGVAARGGVPVYIERADPMAPAFGGLALGATLTMVVALIALSAGVLGGKSDLLTFGDKWPLVYWAGAGLVLSAVFFVVGLVLGKSGK